MSRWHVHNAFGTPVALGTGFKTQLSFLAKTASLCPGQIVEMSLGPLSDPSGTEANIFWEIWRQTVDDGTAGDTLTPYYRGIGDPVGLTCRTLVKGNFSVEPTFTGSKRIFTRSITMRGTLDWIASDQLAPLPWSAVDGNGLGCRAKCASNTPTVLWDADFEDL